MEGLKHADLEADVEPLVRVAATHPNLAKDAVDVLVSGTHTRTKAIPALRKFTTDRNPNVRAAAIRGLVEAATADCASELLAAVQDKDSLVRRAAADSLEQIYDAAQTVHRNADRAGSGGIPTEDAPPASSFSFADLMHPADLLQRLRIKKPDESLDPEEAWRQAYRAGKERPAWMQPLIEPLVKMLNAESADERLAAALALVPLGRDDVALPVLKQLASAQPTLAGAISAALPWLPWTQRSELFSHLVALKLDDNQLGRVAAEMGILKTTAGTAAIWNLATRADGKPPSAELMSTLYWIFSSHYELNSRGEDPFSAQPGGAAISRSTADRLIELKHRAAKGSTAQRMLAMAVLLGIAPDEVPPLAKPIIDDSHADAQLRRSALREWLMAQKPAAGEKEAVARLMGGDPALRRIALVYLSQGPQGLQYLKGELLALERVRSPDDFISRTSGVPIEVAAPEGLRPEQVRPLLRDADPETAATAGYLLATLGEADGLEPLVRYSRRIKRRTRSGTAWSTARSRR